MSIGTAKPTMGQSNSQSKTTCMPDRIVQCPCTKAIIPFCNSGRARPAFPLEQFAWITQILARERALPRLADLQTRGLRQVDFVFDGNEIRGLEQNRRRNPVGDKWPGLARK